MGLHEGVYELVGVAAEGVHKLVGVAAEGVHKLVDGAVRECIS